MNHYAHLDGCIRAHVGKFLQHSRHTVTKEVSQGCLAGPLQTSLLHVTMHQTASVWAAARVVKRANYAAGRAHLLLKHTTPPVSKAQSARGGGPSSIENCIMLLHTPCGPCTTASQSDQHAKSFLCSGSSALQHTQPILGLVNSWQFCGNLSRQQAHDVSCMRPPLQRVSPRAVLPQQCGTAHQLVKETLLTSLQGGPSRLHGPATLGVPDHPAGHQTQEQQQKAEQSAQPNPSMPAW